MAALPTVALFLTIWHQALARLDEKVVADLNVHVISFSAGSSAGHKGGQWQQALSLLDDKRRAGVPLVVISFNKAIPACVCEKPPAVV